MRADVRPLVSVVQMFYNQRAYAEGTLRAMLAQTYSPLEIVVTDDGSTDGTWEVVQRVAAAYAGPHRVVLNRNAAPLGCLGNFQKGCSLAKGELIVNGDGDDVAHPNRVEALTADWLATGKTALLLTSSCDLIDPAGRILGARTPPFAGWDERTPDEYAANLPLLVGASLAVARELYARWPAGADGFNNQDTFYALRALVESRRRRTRILVRFVRDSLFAYRQGVGLSARGSWRASLTWGFSKVLASLREALDAPAVRDDAPLTRTLCAAAARLEDLLVLYTDASFVRRRAAARRLYRPPVPLKTRVFVALLLLPRGLGDLILDGLQRAVHGARGLRARIQGRRCADADAGK